MKDMRKMPVKTILKMIDMFGMVSKTKVGRSEASNLTIWVYEQLKSIHKTLTNENPERS